MFTIWLPKNIKRVWINFHVVHILQKENQYAADQYYFNNGKTEYHAFNKLDAYKIT